MEKTICSYCGTVKETENRVSEWVYFPNRMVYVGNECYRCLNCHNDNDIVIFGKQFISGIFSKPTTNFDNINLNNIEYQKRKKLNKETYCIF
jgi:hypothetical protein